MRRYCYRSPKWLKQIYSHDIWNVDTKNKELFLTFDDGPEPGRTDYVLDLLDRYEARATFFCLGKNMEKHPGLVEKILSSHHAIGNHTFSHRSGWLSSGDAYLNDIERWENVASNFTLSSRLFRPPYGRLKPVQRKLLKAKGLKIIMWSHISGDFDKNLQIEDALRVLLSAKQGAIFLFHDSFAASQNLRKILPQVLKFYTDSGFKFKSLTEDAIS